MSEWDELYMEVILDHNKNPRNKGKIEGYTHSADGHNPLCGDRISMQIIVEDDIVTDASFIGSGCAISTASASIERFFIPRKSNLISPASSTSCISY